MGSREAGLLTSNFFHRREASRLYARRNELSLALVHNFVRPNK